MAACTTTKTDPDPKDEPEIKPDQEIITGELQSDFLELGPAAGVQWLSFYPDDFLEYPELFEGLDADQRRRTRLAPREGANKVLLKFNLPAGVKIKPVDWYGTECVAIDLPDARGFTVAIAEASDTEQDPFKFVQALALQRKAKLGKDFTDSKVLPNPESKSTRLWSVSSKDKAKKSPFYCYGVRVLTGATFKMQIFCEGMGAEEGEQQDFGMCCMHVIKILEGISNYLELALEGSPKHQCKSTIDDLKAGIVAYEKGGLKLALPEGWELRKSGGSSTVEIHGGGAKPLALIRKLAPKNGSLKTRVGADTVFSRRKARPDGFFGAGRALSEQEPFVVAFDYKDRSAEQVALCVIATGNELLTVEIVSSGVIEGEARRKLRDACLEMLKSAKPSATVANSVPDLNELAGWKPQ
ncbi:MAG: hypothetical protein IT461_12280 [Planctomycetes bacterium]|nr:hypothetical protein [Planctomycetota bacterium]